MQAVKDSSALYEWSAARGTRSGRASVSTSCRSRRSSRCRGTFTPNIQDTFYVLEGEVRLFLREPKEDVQLRPGETYSVRPGRPHLVTNAGRARPRFSFCRASASTTTSR